MNRLTSSTTSFIRSLTSARSMAALAACTAICIGSLSLADTQVRLKSGQSWRGELNSQVEVTFKENGKDQVVKGKLLRADQRVIQVERELSGKVSTKTILVADIVTMTSVEGAPATTDGAATGTAAGTTTGTTTAAKPDATKPADPGAFRGVYYMPIKGTVGIGMREEEIRKIGEEADKAGPGQIIVLHIDSPGGIMNEALEIHKTMLELRKRHRVVAWIRKAISAAAFTAFHCDEIYFESSGNLGSMTMFAGQTAVQGQLLADWLEFAGKVAQEGGRNPQIAQCMIKVELELSYDIPPGGGPKDAIFRPDNKGQHILDTSKTMLTFNATPALECGFSDGTADTKEDLAKLLKIPEWREVNDVGENLYESWNRLLERCGEEVEELVYTFGIKDAGGDPVRAMGAQIKTIERLLMWYDRCQECLIEAQMDKGIPVPPKEALEQRLKQLREALAEARRQQRDAGRGN
ncbi:MAG: hypothetical protein JNM94_07465 [Phycisphaerae bacterium]|nr:hypothetical protein [Phycisphaerae bacterium]